MTDPRSRLDGLVREMVAKGILYEDASREFERRFIASRSKRRRQHRPRRRADRHAPQHPQPQDRRIQESGSAEPPRRRPARISGARLHLRERDIYN